MLQLHIDNRRIMLVEPANGILTYYLSVVSVCYMLQVFLEKYGYLDEDNHIHNAVEVQSAVQ